MKMISSKYTIREQNKANILATIIENQEISRADISTITGLNKASVSEITKELLEQEYIFETRVGKASTVGGRKPILLTFNPQAALVISIDLGTDYIEGMLAYIDGEVIKYLSKKEIVVTKEKVSESIKKIIHGFEKIAPTTPHGIVGVTLAIHGIVSQNKILFTPNYNLNQMDLLTELKDIPYPIYLQNEANLAALGEYTFTSSSDNLVSISIHSGIGAGIVQDGLLILGKNGEAGEIGHSILYPDGKACPCGNHGCLEQYASNLALYQEFRNELKLQSCHSDIVAKLWHENNHVAKTILLKNVHHLSIAINNVIMAFSPEVIVINSSIYRKIPDLIDYIQNNLPSQFAQDLVIRNTHLQNRAILFGGFAKAAQEFLHIQNLKLTLKEFK